MSLLAVALVSLWPAALAGAVSAEAGVEYDSNATRAEGEADLVHAPLLRATATGQLQHQAGRHRLRLQLTGGGKLFFAVLPAFTQDVGVIQLSAEETGARGRLRIGGALDYFESFQLGLPARDTRSVSTGLRLSGATPVAERHAFEGNIDLVGNIFAYKPDNNYSFAAPALVYRGLLRLHGGDPELGHDFELALSGRAEYRVYPYDYRYASTDRRDLYVQTGISGAWVGPVLVQLGYTLQLNFSNKEPPPGMTGMAAVPPESYQRHLVLLKLSARVPGDFYLTLKGQLSFLQSAPALFVPVLTIDEENRSLVMADVERPLAAGWALTARYTAFFNLSLPGGERPYQRHTMYLGFSYRYRGSR